MQGRVRGISLCFMKQREDKIKRRERRRKRGGEAGIRVRSHYRICLIPFPKKVVPLPLSFTGATLRHTSLFPASSEGSRFAPDDLVQRDSVEKPASDRRDSGKIFLAVRKIQSLQSRTWRCFSRQRIGERTEASDVIRKGVLSLTGIRRLTAYCLSPERHGNVVCD